MTQFICRWIHLSSTYFLPMTVIDMQFLCNQKKYKWIELMAAPLVTSWKREKNSWHWHFAWSPDARIWASVKIHLNDEKILNLSRPTYILFTWSHNQFRNYENFKPTRLFFGGKSTRLAKLVLILRSKKSWKFEFVVSELVIRCNEYWFEWRKDTQFVKAYICRYILFTGSNRTTNSKTTNYEFSWSMSGSCH